MTPAGVHGPAAQGAELVPGPARRGAGPVAAGLHRASAASRSSSRCAAPTGTSWSSVRADMREKLARERHGGRRRHRLPGRHARAAHHPRPRARRGPGRLGRGRRHHASTRWSAACASASTARAAGASTSGCACWPTSARAPRTWRGCACARARGELVPLSALVTSRRSGRRCRRSPAATASARSPSSPTSRPGTSQSEALADGRAARPADCPTGYRAGARRRQRGLPRVDGQPALRAGPRHRRRVHGARVAVQLVPAPGHGAHHPAAVGRRRGVRAAGHRARRSTSSA